MTSLDIYAHNINMYTLYIFFIIYYSRFCCFKTPIAAMSYNYIIGQPCTIKISKQKRKNC